MRAAFRILKPLPSGCVFLQGYVTAQDRLWQMDFLRRYAAGELAELLGPEAVATDQKSRLLRLRAIAEMNVTRLSADDRAALVEYARGVNYFIDTHHGNYPLEFSIPGILTIRGLGR